VSFSHFSPTCHLAEYWILDTIGLAESTNFEFMNFRHQQETVGVDLL
jgi:hypothetical protein